ncbi:protein indeterminate-domain 12 [Musa acuminata AAA Group]|uniref:protein indeterminate-domain 12 n=1 Tax=Musa acuminata AAA Group TaxID=214697 RepID=UPI0031D6B567
MSNITGDGGSFSSGTNTGEYEVHKQRRLFYGSPATAANIDIAASQLLPVKKKRSLPGTPDPNAEVIALSPTTLMATNRFVCEICHKGFQRDQNLQLHRRGHNLPWKLRQRSSAETRKRVYVCPEPTCVHHHPTRALGDLTGVKKHYCRKHGEKKWKCDKCSKKYAVQSDWKAHSKTCGSREYKCDCGTIFSRRDSFVTHRAFCDALAQENHKLSQPLMATMASSLQGHVPGLTMPVQLTDTDHLMPAYMAGGTLSCLLNPPSTSNVRSPMGFDGLIGAQMSRPMAHVSATALLQEAEQVGGGGGIAHGMMQNGGLGSVMTGPDSATGTRPCIPFKAHELSYQMVGVGGAGSGDQFWDADGSLKHTVDFLGVRGERRLQLQQQQQQFGGVGHGERIESLHPLQQLMGHGGSRAED